LHPSTEVLHLQLHLSPLLLRNTTFSSMNQSSYSNTSHSPLSNIFATVVKQIEAMHAAFDTEESLFKLHELKAMETRFRAKHVASSAEPDTGSIPALAGRRSDFRG
jgi:hypothetical protein